MCDLEAGTRGKGIIDTSSHINCDQHHQHQYQQLEDGEDVPPPLVVRAVVAAATIVVLILLYPLYIGKLAFDNIAPTPVRQAVYGFWSMVVDEIRIR